MRSGDNIWVMVITTGGLTLNKFEKGYEYAKSEWNKSPNEYTARRLYIESDSIDFNDFDRGMLEALSDLNVPDPFDPTPR